MSASIAYVNGRYQRVSDLAIGLDDRGFQFADSIYEVWGVRGGRLLDESGHHARLKRSLNALEIAMPMPEASLRVVLKETMRRNRVTDGLIYLQISRGRAPRDHVFPSGDVAPTIVVTAKNLNLASLEKRGAEGVSVITHPETRWARRDIKTTALLPNVLAREKAKRAGAFEAWFVDDDGLVTEATASNAWIVDAQGRLRTRELSERILHGITRARVAEIAAELQIAVLKHAFSVAEALGAREAFITSATNGPVPVIAIDGAPIGDGRPGPVTARLRAAYFGAPRKDG